LVVAAAAVAASVSMARPALAEDYPENAGWGVLAVFANLGYMPVKTTYAVLGALTGSLAYVCTGGSYDTASSIWEMSMGGTYVLTPAMIRGDDPIAFAGESSSTSAVSDAASDEPPAQRSRREEGLPPS
jgi:hypothetical protein